jgi:membrane protein required for colicin V production
MTELGWIDWALIAIVALSVLLGIARGLTREIMSLAGWIMAYWAAQAFCAQVAPEVPLGSPGSGLNLAAAFVVVLVSALVAWSFCSWLVGRMVKASLLNPIDRTLGAVFGLVRGLLLVLLVGTLTLLTPLSQEPAWRASHGAASLHYVLAELKPLLPASVARHLRAAAAPSGAQSKG